MGGKELRADLARAEHLTPILTKQLRDAEKMASAIVRRLLETEEARGCDAMRRPRPREGLTFAYRALWNR